MTGLNVKPKTTKPLGEKNKVKSSRFRTKSSYRTKAQAIKEKN